MAPNDLRQVADHFAAEIPHLTDELGRLVQSVRPGTVVTYGDLASALGDVVASRWVATVLLDVNGPLLAHSHRVVRSTGELGLYASGNVQEKEGRLAAEGIRVRDGKVDLATYRAPLPRTDAPLARLKRWQQSFEMPAASPIPVASVRQIGGVDVSYSGETAVAVCTWFDGEMRHVGQLLHQQTVRFPYVSGYLSFREIPVYLELLARLQQENQLPDVLLVDGNGRLHPRRCGIASMLGAVAGIPTIGVAKKLLHGTLVQKQLEVGIPWPITASDDPAEILGYAILPTAKTKHPIYVSQGFGVDDQTMLSVVRRCLTGHRSPEPIYLADRLSRQAADRLRTAL